MRAPRVHFLTAQQTPVANTDTNVSVTNIVAGASAASFSCATSDLAGMAFTLEADRIAEPCRPVLSVNSSQTDDLGVASFNGFSLVRGPPGIWTVEFSAGAAVADSDMTISSALSTMIIDGSSIPPDSFVPGQPLTVQPRLQLLLKSNVGAPGRSVVAFVSQSPFVMPPDALNLDVERHDFQGQRFGTLLVRGVRADLSRLCSVFTASLAAILMVGCRVCSGVVVLP